MNELLQRKSVVKVKEYLQKIDKSIKLIVLKQTARTAADAAKSLDKEVGSIVKGLLFKDNKEYYLCLISGDKYASIDKISNIIGNKIRKTDAKECKKFTGFSIGGVSPFAHDNAPKLIIIDENLSRFEKIYAAAGNSFVVFEISFTKLSNLTNGLIKDIT